MTQLTLIFVITFALLAWSIVWVAIAMLSDLSQDAKGFAFVQFLILVMIVISLTLFKAGTDYTDKPFDITATEESNER